MYIDLGNFFFSRPWPVISAFAPCRMPMGGEHSMTTPRRIETPRRGGGIPRLSSSAAGIATTVLVVIVALVLVSVTMSAQLLPGSIWGDRRVTLMAAEKEKNVRHAMKQLQEVLEQQASVIEHLRVAQHLARGERRGMAFQRELEQALHDTSGINLAAGAEAGAAVGAVAGVAAATGAAVATTGAAAAAAAAAATDEVTGAATGAPSPGEDSISSASRLVPLTATDATTALDPTRIAVVVIAYDRPSYLERALQKLLKIHPGGGAFTIYVSQDGKNADVSRAISNAGVRQLIHPRRTLSLQNAPEYLRKNPGYAYLSVHYGWALRQMFADAARYEGVIVLEEDLEVSDDFFGYFAAAAPLLYQDGSLLAVSGFNDHGQAKYSSDAHALRRTDFFPGLGWLLTRRLWGELAHKWPEAHGFWDDWLREPAQRQGRACIVPELSRTRTFGAMGTSHSQFYNQYLTKIALAKEGLPDWRGADLSHLLRDAYEASFAQQLAAATRVGLEEALKTRKKGEARRDLRVGYGSASQLQMVCSRLEIMMDLKAGVPRQAYHGVISLRVHGNRLLIAPDYKVDQDVTMSRLGDWKPLSRSRVLM